MQDFAVDPHSGWVQDWHVYKNFSVTLNFTDIDYNQLGSNKFYIIQVLEKNTRNKFCCLTWYGRVGLAGNTNLLDHYDVKDAIDEFKGKFYEKTGNRWGEKFIPLEGKYKVVDI